MTIKLLLQPPQNRPIHYLTDWLSITLIQYKSIIDVTALENSDISPKLKYKALKKLLDFLRIIFQSGPWSHSHIHSSFLNIFGLLYLIFWLFAPISHPNYGYLKPIKDQRQRLSHKIFCLSERKVIDTILIAEFYSKTSW